MLIFLYLRKQRYPKKLLNSVFFSHRDKLPSDKPILENNFVATHCELNAQENISIVTFIEKESIRLARERNFYGIFSINSNELTQQLDESVFGYETLFDFQANQFVVDGKTPYTDLPDSVHWMVQFKKI